MIEKYKPSHLEKPSVQGQTRQLAVPSIVEEDYIAGVKDLIAASFFSAAEDRLGNGNHILVRLLLLTWFLLLTRLILVLFENFIDDICFLAHWSDFLLFLKQEIIPVFQRILSAAFELLLYDRPLLLALAFQHYLQQLFILVLVPWSFLDSWVEVAAPMFPALLCSPVYFLL